MFWLTVLWCFVHIAGQVQELPAVVRECSSRLQRAGNLPFRLTDRCLTTTFDYNVQGMNVVVNGTVCPCVTELCNAGAITYGGTAGTAAPPSTRNTIQPAIPTTATTTCVSSRSSTAHSSTRRSVDGVADARASIASSSDVTADAADQSTSPSSSANRQSSRSQCIPTLVAVALLVAARKTGPGRCLQ